MANIHLYYKTGMNTEFPWMGNELKIRHYFKNRIDLKQNSYTRKKNSSKTCNKADISLTFN